MEPKPFHIRSERFHIHWIPFSQQARHEEKAERVPFEIGWQGHRLQGFGGEALINGRQNFEKVFEDEGEVELGGLARGPARARGRARWRRARWRLWSVAWAAAAAGVWVRAAAAVCTGRSIKQRSRQREIGLVLIGQEARAAGALYRRARAPLCRLQP